MRAIVASAFLLGAASTEAGPVPRAGSVLNVDFGTTNLGLGEQGFHTFKLVSAGSAGPLTKNFGVYTVTVANGATVNSTGQLSSTATLLSRDRLAPLTDSGSFTYNNLYRDMITGATTLATQISGLSPNTPYTIVFHAYDNNNAGNVTFTNITGATSGAPNGTNTILGSIVWTANATFGSVTSNDVYSLAGNVVSDSNGRLTFRQAGTANCLNAIRLFGPPTLAVDIGQSQSPSLVETGFQEFEVTNYPSTAGPIVRNFGNMTVRLAGGANVDSNGFVNSPGTFVGRDRGQPSTDSGGFTYNDLYRDFVAAQVDTMAIQITGLEPETPYELLFYTYDHSNGRTNVFTDITGATSSAPNGVNRALGSVTWVSGTSFGSGTPNDVFTLRAIATSDASGRLTFRQTNAVGPILNGISLWAPAAKPIPGPTLMGIKSDYPANYEGLLATETWLGKQLPAALTFMETKEWPSGTVSWDGFDDGVDYMTNPTGWPSTRWQAIYSVPLIPHDGGPTLYGTTLADMAAGQYLDHFERLAEKLVAAGEADAFIRISHEMNGTWYNWSVANATNAAAFKGAWIQVVQRMRSVAGQRFKFDYNPGANGVTGSYALYPDAWPGAYYVSCVGIDIYDAGKIGSYQFGDVRWSQLIGSDTPASQGLLFWSNMAAARNLPISFPEWATGGGGSGTGGDSPYFIRKMYEWMQNYDVAYHCYWNSSAGWNGTLTDGHLPKAAAVFKELFGRDEYYNEDIGSVGLAGITNFNPATGTYTIQGAGAGLGGGADAFHYAYAPKMGNLSFQARLASTASPSGTATSGIMIRESEAAGSPFACAAMTESGSVFFKYRDATGGSVQTEYTSTGTLPIWFKLSRAGNLFTAYRSTDGVNWSAMGASKTITMSSASLAGMFNSSASTSALSSAVFDQVNAPIELVLDSEFPTTNGSITFSPAATDWGVATALLGYHGASYRHDGNTGKADTKNVVFTPAITEAGLYNVYVWHAMSTSGNATNVPVQVTHAAGTSTITVNQQREGNTWYYLGSYNLTPSAGHNVKICTKTPGGGANTNGTVQADAVRLFRAR